MRKESATPPINGVGPLLFLLCALVLIGAPRADRGPLAARGVSRCPPTLLYLLGGLLIALSLPIWVASARGVLACQRRGVLLTQGVYRLCRHPMYGNAICLALTGVCLLWRSWVHAARAPHLPGHRAAAGDPRRALDVRGPRPRLCPLPRADALPRAALLARRPFPFIAPLRTGPVATDGAAVTGIHNLAASLFLVETS